MNSSQFSKSARHHVNNVELGRHGRNRTNVWDYAGVNTFKIGRRDELAMHPTVKPVALVADVLKDASRRSDLVLDPFAGSGTTIIAAQKTGRQAYALEIDPRYVDVIIERWQLYTGRPALLGCHRGYVRRAHRTKKTGPRLPSPAPRGELLACAFPL